MQPVFRFLLQLGYERVQQGSRMLPDQDVHVVVQNGRSHQLVTSHSKNGRKRALHGLPPFPSDGGCRILHRENDMNIQMVVNSGHGDGDLLGVLSL